ncbi:hypothetical protein [Streptomyces torulosus]|uniref:hypothetical protein n=1 Tax=Streptomyces torulosus TaxID=68276 RepID=UPI000AA05FB7|nr:hypothetical protein [Streptomyces torulosus]
MTELFTTPDEAIRAVLFIAALGVSLSLVEDMHRSDVFAPAGLLSWTVLRITSQPSRPRPLWQVLDRVFAPAPFAWTMRLALTSSLGLATALLYLPRASTIIATLTAAVFGWLLLLNCRTVFGLDGAHHMHMVVFGSSTLFFLAPAGSLASGLCVVFIAAQAVLAYTASGVVKLLGPMWRRGEAVTAIMSTCIYGRAWLWRFLEARPAAAFAACWSVIIFECCFLLTLVAGPGLLQALLVLGVLFHGAVSVFMGLNGFFVIFVATYPAVVYLNQLITDHGFLS